MDGRQIAEVRGGAGRRGRREGNCDQVVKNIIKKFSLPRLVSSRLITTSIPMGHVPMKLHDTQHVPVHPTILS